MLLWVADELCCLPGGQAICEAQALQHAECTPLEVREEYFALTLCQTSHLDQRVESSMANAMTGIDT